MSNLSCWLAAGVLIVGTAQVAETDVDPLAALVAEALRNSPDVQAAEAALAAARERPEQARVVPDPTVSLLYTNEGWRPTLGEMPDSVLTVMASQALPPRGERGLRARIAITDVEVGAQQLARTRRSIEASVRRAWYGLAEARAQRVLADEQHALWTQTEAVARARYAVGQGTQHDVLRVQVELTRVEQSRIQQEVEEELRLAELARLVGRVVVVETAALAPPRAPDEAADAVAARLVASSPELAAARAAVEKARLDVDLARVQWKPTVAVQAGYMNRGPFDPMWQAGVTVGLPVRQGARRAGLVDAEQRLRVAESQLRVTGLDLRLRTTERLAQLATAQRLYELYDGGIVPQGQMAVEAALASYRSGQVPLLSVLESLSTLFLDRAARNRFAAGHARARVSLEEAALAPSDLAPMGAR
jgi:outer membrane protein, heavy metal efflux system